MTPTDIQFRFDWEEPGGAAGAELRATWARLEIHIGGQAVSRVHDLRTRSTRDYLYLPLYPLAEWLVLHWWQLFREIDSPEREGYFRRHDLRFAGEGFSLPSLRLMPQGEGINIEWSARRSPTQSVEFIESGKATVAVQSFENSLRAFIEAVVGRLVASGITGTLLQDEWQALGALDAEEQTFCEIVGALGLDPFALDDVTGASIIELVSNLPHTLLPDFLACANAESLADQVALLRSAIEQAQSGLDDLIAIKMLKRQLGGFRHSCGNPWEAGYQAARAVRTALRLNGAEPGSLDALGLTGDSSTFVSNNAGKLFDAVVGTNINDSPGFVVSSRSDEAVRFAICRGFFEYLASSSGQPVIVSHSRSLSQKRNRAFAAEFLVPAEFLKSRVSGREVYEDDLIRLAAECGVAQQVVRHQLENHRIAEVVDEW